MLQQKEIDDLASRFIRLASVDNPSGKEEKMVKAVQHELSELGIVPQVDEWSNMFFHIEGEGAPIFLNAHLDSVQPCEGKNIIFEDGMFFTDKTTVLGADDIEGVNVIISTLRYLKKHNIKHRPLDILFTTQEEIGGVGIKHFDLSVFKAKQGLVLDSAAPVGKFVVRSPAKYNFSFFIKGIAGHGGHTKGTFSAIVMMAELMHKLPIGQIDEYTKLNVGRIEGGKSLNTVPGNVKMDGGISVFSDGEIRGADAGCKKVIEKIEQAIQECEEKYPQGTIDFQCEQVRAPYIHDEADPFLAEIDVAIESCGLTPDHITSNGVSDANTLYGLGYKGILLGTGAKGLHTVNECLPLSEMVKLMEITIKMCEVK